MLRTKITFHHKQILACLGVALCMLASASFYGYRQLKQTEVTAEWINHTFNVITKLQQVETNVHELVVALRTYVFTSKQRYYDDFHKKLPEVQLLTNELHTIVTDNPRQAEATERLRQHVDKLSLHYQTILTLLVANKTEEAWSYINKGIGQVHIDQITELLDKMYQEEKKLLKTRIAENYQARHGAKSIFLLTSSLGMILLALAIYFLYREFRRRLEIQAKLDESSEIQRIMLESTAHSIIAVDMEGKIRFFNPAAEKLLGYKASEVLGKNPAIFHVPEEMASAAHELSKRFNEIIPLGLPVFTEKARRNLSETEQWTYVRKDGSTLPVQLTTTAQRDADGNITGFMSIAYDNSKQLEYERAIIESREEALAGTRAKSEFLANMSHEIRTPMNAILGMAELLNETNLNEEQKKYVDIFHRAGEGLLNIINDVLDLSKIETSHFELNKSSFALSNVIAKTSEIIALKAHQKQLEFAIDLEVGLHDRYFGDAQRIRQILLNLLGNAVKFTKKGEILLSVKAGKIYEKTVEIIMQVNDTGIGMKQEQVNKLFERFTQADMSITREYGGTGLGLNITKRLVELMNGTIKIESTLGIGTKITLSLNLDKENNEIPEIDHRRFAGMKVLIVDDTRTNRMIFKKIVEYHGAIAEEAEDGESALTMIKKKAEAKIPYDILLIDFRMPGMDGFKLAELIQQDPRLAGSLLIMLTSDNRPGDFNKALNIGIHSYLMKPILKDELLEAIEQGLNRREQKTSEVSANRLINETQMSTKKILLVDDNEENRFTIRAFMRGQPWIVDEAKDGLEALKLFKERTYDIILMDIQMPQMDGYTCTRSIRALEEELSQQRTPIVALTAYALKEDVEKSLGAGCDDHLPKPIRKLALLSTIEKHTEKTVETLSEELKLLVPGFLKNRARELVDLKLSLEKNDFDSIQKIGHKLTGSAGSLNFDDLCQIARQLEARANARDLDGLKTLIEKYEKTLKTYH